MKSLKLSVLALVTVAALPAQANQFAVGAAVVVSPSPYAGDQDRVLPIPMVSYEGEHAYFKGLTGGVHVWQNEQHRVSVNAYYLPLSFKPDDSDIYAMKRLDKRNATLMAGLLYRYTHPTLGVVRVDIGADTLNNSNGVLGDIGYLYRFNFGQWGVTPGIGVTWASSNHNEYYYGVSGAESMRSGLAQYQPGSSWTPYIELSVGYRINQNWSAFLAARGMALPKEVKDSPMVDSSVSGTLIAGFNYAF
ncbi:MipA/OmpV family protein [Serratia microhaemolytica]|uniref:MipA/OmpV family protein n=1 Tax=Serratia microhaemolytica TaxID=2675110 RepID=UPI000FDE08FE|nr:MipA/OmpV family protein [Serratia microhaemolytica]